jgi:hypothetical protein
MLGYMDDQQSVNYLEALMKAEHNVERFEARNGLIRKGSIAVPIFIKILENNSNSDIMLKWDAIVALGELQDKSALPILERIVNGELLKDLAFTTQMAIEKIQADDASRQARRKVWLLIEDVRDIDVAHEIAKIGSAATPILIEMVTRSVMMYESRHEPTVYKALAAIGDPEAIKFLADRIGHVVGSRSYGNNARMLEGLQESILSTSLVQLGPVVIPHLKKLYNEHTNVMPNADGSQSRDTQIRKFITDVIKTIRQKKQLAK